jgi:hypothetical protein
MPRAARNPRDRDWPLHAVARPGCGPVVRYVTSAARESLTKAGDETGPQRSELGRELALKATRPPIFSEDRTDGLTRRLC